ncbi:hypothetical protein, partial [Nocardia sp. JMUB6875]|uniref:hypothetical protein n=1 Tax=Nocardia sp. JMUB6875 TaxID=3158170 RepID=UPI0034E89E42
MSGEGPGSGDTATKERGLLEVPEVLDARLVPAAVFCWGATTTALMMGWVAGVGVAVACLLVGMCVAAVVVRGARRGRGSGVAWIVLG